MEIKSYIDVWHSKKALRMCYEKWYKNQKSDMSEIHGINIELGSGISNIKFFIENIITSDVNGELRPDMVFDAYNIPFEDNTLSNILMLDVVHHLYDPVRFLEIAYKKLKSKGRILMVEPYPSIWSLPIYKIFHNEPFNFKIDYFNDDLSHFKSKDPWDSNQAIPYLIFFKNEKKFNDNFGKKYRIIKKERMDFILYPLSGGYGNPQLVPNKLIKSFLRLEATLEPLSKFMAFRCYVVLEKL